MATVPASADAAAPVWLMALCQFPSDTAADRTIISTVLSMTVFYRGVGHASALTKWVTWDNMTILRALGHLPSGPP